MSNKIDYKIGDKVRVAGINNITAFKKYKNYIDTIATVLEIEDSYVTLDIPSCVDSKHNTKWDYDEIEPYKPIQLFTL